MSPTTVSVFAPAKVNLSLHVTGQRADGYHLLDTLVAFASVGDHLRIASGETLSLSVDGAEADGVPAGMENLVLRAAALMEFDAKVELSLEKNLPLASGIGAGSADAAAAYRGLLAFSGYTEALERLQTVTDPGLSAKAAKILALGADVPMCLISRPARVRGIGEKLEPVSLPSLPAVLVNPRVPVSTPVIFRELSRKENPPMPDTLPGFRDAVGLVDWLSSQRSDLESPAIHTVPLVNDVLAALQAIRNCKLARMSGSGATCFGLFADIEAANVAADQLRLSHPDWWITGCVLGDQSDAARPRIS